MTFSYHRGLVLEKGILIGKILVGGAKPILEMEVNGPWPVLVMMRLQFLFHQRTGITANQTVFLQNCKLIRHT